MNAPMSKSEIAVMDQTGHTRHIWDASVPDEVAAVKQLFDSFIAKGYKAFRVKKDGSDGERMKAFEPDAERMILMKAIQGG